MDKLLHLLVGQFLFCLLLPYMSPLQAFKAVIVVALAKEAFDYGSNVYRRRHGLLAQHTVDPLDFLATIAGPLAYRLAADGAAWLATYLK